MPDFPFDPDLDNPQALAAARQPQFAPDPDLDNPVGTFVSRQARQGASWSDVAPTLKDYGGGNQFESTFKLEAARGRQAKEGESDLEYYARRSGPIASALGNWAREKRYQTALQKLDSGTAEDADYEAIARHERLQEIDKETESTYKGAIQSAVAQIPALAGEAYLTRGIGFAPRAGAGLAPRLGLFAASQTAKTPLMPSLYLQQGAQEQTAHPEESTGEAYGKALAYGAMNNIVLGQLQARVGAPGGLVGRTLAKTGLGMAEQQAVDVLAGATKLHTGYGLAGEFLDPKVPADDAWKHATVQAVTFAAFSGHHEVMESWAKAGQSLKKADVPPEEAASILTQVQTAARSAPTPEARKAVVDAIPDHFPQEFKDYAQAVVDASAGPPASRARQRGLAPPVNVTAGEPLNRQRGREQAPETTQTTTEGQTAPVAPESTQPRFGQQVASEPSGQSISRPGAAQGQEQASEFDPIRDALFRVPDSKRQLGTSNLGSLRSELLGGAVGKSSSRGAEANDPHWKEGQFQIVLDPNHLPPEAVRPGSGHDVKADFPSLAENPALLAVRFKGSADHAAFTEAKDLIDGINGVRIGKGLEPIALFSKEGQAPVEPVKMTAAERMRAGQARREQPAKAQFPDGGPAKPAGEPLSPEQHAARGWAKMGKAEETVAKLREAKARHEKDVPPPPAEKPVQKTQEQRDRESHERVVMSRLASRSEFIKKVAADPSVDRIEQAKAMIRDMRAALASIGKNPEVELKKTIGNWGKVAKQLGLTPGEIDNPARIAWVPPESWPQWKKKIANLLPNQPGKSLAAEVLSRNGIDPKDSEFLAHYSSKAEAVENGIPEAIFRKGTAKHPTLGLDILARGMKEHVGGGEPADLLAALSEGRESLLHGDFERANRSLEDRHNEQQRLADDERQSEEMTRAMTPEEQRRILRENAKRSEARLFREQLATRERLIRRKRERREAQNNSFDVDKIEAESAAERLLGEQIARNKEGPLPEAMGAASFGFKPQNKPMREQVAAHLKESAKRWVQGVQDFVGRLGGQIAPTISRASEAAGNMVARLGAVGHYARLWPTVMLDRIMPAGSGQADRLRLGATMVEWVLRDIRDAHVREGAKASRIGSLANDRARNAAQRARMAPTPELRRDARIEAAQATRERAAAFQKANEHRQKAGDVISVVGGSFKDPSMAYPLPDEAAYQAALADPAIQRMIAKHKSEAAPDLIRFFEQATGKKHDEFDSLRNFDAMPISLVVPHEGEPSGTTFIPGTSRGKLGNQRLRRISASYEATGSSSKGYELDYGKILERMAADRFPTGTKAEAYRVWEKEGIGRWGKPGDTLGVNGETWKRMPDVTPPKGTQANQAGETAFFVDPKYYDEIHQVLGLNKPPGRVPFSSVLSTLTLASTVEAAYHTRNLLTMLTRPGMNPLDVIRHARKLALGDPDTMKAVLHLAELGAMKEHGFEAETLGGKYNPLTYFNKATSALLSVVDRSVRLAASDAFDRVAKIEGVENTERARRDFINQVGNYSKLTQSRVVAWLRDTGLGPFATAGSTFYMAGLKGMVGSHGLRTTSYKADVRLRAEMLLRMATLPAIAAALNYAIWGRVDGDDQTPVFGLKLGTGDNGRTSYLDLGGLTGITRGMRETGLLSLAEASRPAAKARGSTTGDVVDRGVKDAARSALHPAIGPVVAFADTLLTGKNSLGGNIAPRADLKKGESQTELNLWAALWHSNLILESLEHPARELVGIEDRRREKPTWEVLSKFLGPFGPKTSGNVPGEPHRTREMPVPASPIQGRELQAKKRLLAPPRR